MLTEHDVRDWFYFVAWLKYKTYTYSRHKIMITRWWAEATVADLQQSRDIRRAREGQPPVLREGEARTALPLPVIERPQMQGARQRRKAPQTVSALLDDLMKNHG